MNLEDGGNKYGAALRESVEDVNTWLEKSADQLQATYETQTIGQNMDLEKTQFIDLKDGKKRKN